MKEVFCFQVKYFLLDLFVCAWYDIENHSETGV